VKFTVTSPVDYVLSHVWHTNKPRSFYRNLSVGVYACKSSEKRFLLLLALTWI